MVRGQLQAAALDRERSRRNALIAVIEAYERRGGPPLSSLSTAELEAIRDELIGAAAERDHGPPNEAKRGPREPEYSTEVKEAVRDIRLAHPSRGAGGVSQETIGVRVQKKFGLPEPIPRHQVRKILAEFGLVKFRH